MLIYFGFILHLAAERGSNDHSVPSRSFTSWLEVFGTAGQSHIGQVRLQFVFFCHEGIFSNSVLIRCIRLQHIFRIFWLLAILGSVVFSAYLIFIGVVQPMFANPILISFQASEITIDQIPFPAFTICNVNKVKKDVVLELERYLVLHIYSKF
jgi:hypothetical protein